MYYVLCVFLFVMKLIFCLCYSVVVYSMCVYICTCSIYVSNVCTYRCVFMCAFIYTCICLIVNFHIFYCSARTKAPLASVPITLEGKTMS